ncbi:MAG: hypothetical protein CFH10_02266, partial [Alphaproteobacteria bacterium MarineAlpha4_Bin2]
MITVRQTKAKNDARGGNLTNGISG